MQRLVAAYVHFAVLQICLLNRFFFKKNHFQIWYCNYEIRAPKWKDKQIKILLN